MISNPNQGHGNISDSYIILPWLAGQLRLVIAAILMAKKSLVICCSLSHT